jgi:hypothetical protein
MRVLIAFLLGLGRPKADAAALIGDLEEEYRGRLAAGGNRVRARASFLCEVLLAAARGVVDGVGRTHADRRRVPHRRGSVSRLLDPADVRVALRRWRCRPAAPVAVVLTLALGIGTTTALFSVVDAVILRPWAWPQPDRLAVVHAVFPGRVNDPARSATWNRAPLTWPMWDALRGASSFEDVAAWQVPPFPNTTLGEARTELVSMVEASSGLLPMLGAQVLHGRDFNGEDDSRPTRTIVLPYETWQRRFGGRPEVVGETVITGSASSGGRIPRTVVGILGPGLSFPDEIPELFFNLGTAADVFRTSDGGTLRVLARLKGDVTATTANVEARTLIEGLQRKEPASARLVPLVEEYLGDTAQPLWLLFAGAGLLLLVACANVAGLLLGEGCSRRHEFGVRAALGGLPARALRQLFVEHAVLAMAGAAAGLVLASWLVHGLVALAPDRLPRVDAAAVDGRIAAFALGLGGLTLLVFGTAPAWALARTPAVQVLAEGRPQGGSSRHRGQRLLVAAELALTLVLLVGAMLFGETLLRVAIQPLGFDPSNLAVVSTTYTGPAFDTGALRAAQLAARRDPSVDYRAIQNDMLRSRGVARTERVTAALSAVPGVALVAGTWRGLPLLTRPSGIATRSWNAQAGPDAALPREPDDVQWQVVTDRYFATMSMPIVAGRSFDTSDADRGPLVAVVSRTFERRVFDGSAVGRRFLRAPGSSAVSVIGVVPDVGREESYRRDDRPTYYLLGRQVGPVQEFVVRTSGDPATLLPQIRRAIAEVDPQIVVTSATTMKSLLGRLRAHEQFRATLSACFSGAALFVAAVGLYGLAARRTADRAREFGIRVVLGARPASLRALALQDCAVIVGAGLIVGLPAAAAVAQALQSWLFGVSPTAPHVFLLASTMLAAAAFVATFAPAQRAGRLDPVRALKN